MDIWQICLVELSGHLVVVAGPGVDLGVEDLVVGDGHVEEVELDGADEAEADEDGQAGADADEDSDGDDDDQGEEGEEEGGSGLNDDVGQHEDGLLLGDADQEEDVAGEGEESAHEAC